ncbi:MAG: sulfate ABC transporter permease [Algoriphagus sp.]|uniref:sulfate ABC transporter permease n=1 Tax=Algoriphagus sp. TaxID=1872435 RepID=UPI0018282E74|nr:sulfate ABC transporter permease [Algoriphagus sp.]NVJ85576.1 sulfate ABC transporter permease [Algoriphagus sp.]
MALPSSRLSQRIQELLDFDKRLYFLLLVLLFVLIRFLTNTLIVEAIPDSQNLKKSGALTFFYIFNTLEYIWTPFALLWKFTVISFLIWVGAFALGYKVPYKELWEFALVAEIVFLLPELVRFLIYLNPDTSITYLEIQENRPLSLLSFIGYEQVEERLRYPFGTFNFFELIYGAVWVLGFHSISRRSIQESVWVILLSYFLPLLIWVTWYAMVYR